VARRPAGTEVLVEREVRSVRSRPEAAMSYLMGKKALLDVKDAYQRIRGRAYSKEGGGVFTTRSCGWASCSLPGKVLRNFHGLG